MEGKRIYALLVLLVACVFAGCVVVVIFSDRNAPEIIFSEAGMVSEYTDDMDTEALLAGVQAYDEEEGDVTDSLTIINIIVLDNGEHIKVTYAAKDSKNNVAQKSKKIKYSGDENFINVSVAEGESQTESIAPTPEATTSVPETTTEPPVDLTQTGGSGQPVKINQEQVNATGVPQIELHYTDYVIKVGDTFGTAEGLDMVSQTFDDKDSVSNRIVIGGIKNVDTSTAGDYVLEYSVSDTEGNRSEVQTLTLHVVE